MPTFLLITRHSPESCPAFNEKARKAALALMDKSDEYVRKHGVKMIGGWIAPSEHLIVEVLEAPSLEAWEKCGMEPEVMAWTAFNTTEVKMVVSYEEGMSTLKESK